MDDDAAVCIANIGPRERRNRQRFGMALMAVAILVAGLLIALGTARLWRLALLLPLAAGALGFFQARAQT